MALPDPTPVETPGGNPVHEIIIIGAGFGGLGLAVSLKKEGVRDFLILERAQDVGGVWRDNGYPGAACDVPSHLYSFSFEPNPEWSHVFARRDEIFAYLRHCARKYGLLEHVRLGTEVRGAAFDDATHTWSVALADGSTLRCKTLVTATGQLSRPAIPAIEGQDSFAGVAFHSAQWNHDCDLRGKRVAVIGTGASAVQFVPAIAEQVAHLDVFQRSGNYILPRPDRPIPEWEKALFRRLPAAMKLARLKIYLMYEARALGFTRAKWLMTLLGGWPFKRHLRAQVADAALRAKLVPDYPIGCKRILLSSDYLATLARPQVSLVTDPIRRITPQGVETRDGVVHPADVIIYGTGFAATDFLAPMRVRGSQGQDLHSAWAGGAQAYLGMAVPGFPNFFMLYGPNTNLGHNSIVYMLEGQIAHLMRILRAQRQRHATRVEVDATVFARFNRRVQERLAHTVWNGCKSWYIDASGHSSTNWPGFTLSYRWLTTRSSLSVYRFSPAG